MYLKIKTKIRRDYDNKHLTKIFFFSRSFFDAYVFSESLLSNPGNSWENNKSCSFVGNNFSLPSNGNGWQRLCIRGFKLGSYITESRKTVLLKNVPQWIEHFFIFRFLNSDDKLRFWERNLKYVSESICWYFAFFKCSNGERIKKKYRKYTTGIIIQYWVWGFSY